tara:strand:+ start:2780 stop:3106 length:327 start_codon:yes stop_codon:yes gene_type:complete
MENMKLPITVIGIIILQISGFIWWTAQQASTIYDLEETVSSMSSSMAIADRTNLKRDVEDNAGEIVQLWGDVNGLAMSIMQINEIKQRISTIEVEMRYINRDHEGIAK